MAFALAILALPGATLASLVLMFAAYLAADGMFAMDGLGLGLFVVRRARDLLGHKIEVRSTIGRGSCFAILADAAPPLRILFH